MPCPQGITRDPVPARRTRKTGGIWWTHGLPPVEAVPGLMLARSDPPQATLEAGIDLVVGNASVEPAA